MSEQDVVDQLESGTISVGTEGIKGFAGDAFGKILELAFY